MAKRLSALLAFAMLAAMLLAGCTNATPVASANQTVAPTTAPDVSAPPIAEKNEISMKWSGTVAPGGDPYGDFLLEKFKVKIEMVAVDSVEKVKMLAASDSLPDLIGGGMGVGDPTFMQLKTDGMIRDIPDEMIAKYPTLKAAMDNHLILAPLKTSFGGKNYWLPIYGYADGMQKAMLMPFYYRADWAQKLGIATPTTVDEYYQMMKAFTEKDPDGNGQNDTYGLTGWLWQVHFITWVDMYSWVKGDDGKWVPGFVTPKMHDALAFYNKLYQEKILDPEFSGANGKNMFMQDKVGVMCANSSAWHVWNNIYKGFAGTPHGGVTMSTDEAMAAVQFLPPLKADAGSQPQWAASQDIWGNAISANTSDEVVDRILEITEWELSPEGRDFMTYGFLDTDYMIKDGKAVQILPTNPSTGTMKKLWEVYPSVNAWGITMGFHVPYTPALNPVLPQECTDRENQWEATAAPYSPQPNLLINNISTPAKDKCSVAPAGAVEPDIQKLVASANFEADWAAMLDSWMNGQGLQAAIDEVNAKIQADGLDK